MRFSLVLVMALVMTAAFAFQPIQFPEGELRIEDVKDIKKASLDFINGLGEGALGEDHIASYDCLNDAKNITGALYNLVQKLQNEDFFACLPDIAIIVQ